MSFVPIASVSCGYSSIESYTRGRIKCGYTLRDLQDFGEDIYITFIYYCTDDENHGDKLNRKHYYLILEDSQYNYHKLDLSCVTSFKNIQVMLSKEIPSKFQYIYRKKIYGNITLKNIGIWIEEEYESKVYNQVTNDCNKFAYSVIYKFCEGFPEHTSQVLEKLEAIFFCLSDIERAGNMIEHAYVIIQTDSYSWKCEISGCDDKCYLNIENVDGSFNYYFKANYVKTDLSLNDVIEKSERQWGNQTYGTLTNNCYDYCKFIMREFTYDKENINKVNSQENANMVVGGLTLAQMGAAGSIGAEIGLVGGPVGAVVGFSIGAVGGLLSAMLAKTLGKNA